MATGRGFVILTVSFLFLLGGRLLGIQDFYEVGGGLVLIVIAGIAVTARAKQSVSAARSVVPPRVTAGRPASVEITITNDDRRHTPPLLYKDSLPPHLVGKGRFGVTPVPSNSKKTASYEVVGAKRGVYDIGPGELTFTDPYGTATKRVQLVGTSRITVHPEVETLAQSGGLGERFGSGKMRRFAPTTSGGEFFTLREFQAGDDLRKIHWPSTARLGKPMLRQEEQQRQMLATIVLDDRHDRHRLGTPDSFEQSVRSAASMIGLYMGSGFYVRLAFVGAPGPGGRTEFGRGTDHYNHLLDSLSVVTITRQGDLAAKLASLRASSTGGVLVIVTTDAESAYGALKDRLADRSAFKMVVIHPLHDFLSVTDSERAAREKSLDGVLRLMRDSGITHVVSRAGRSLAEAWVERQGAPRAARGGAA